LPATSGANKPWYWPFCRIFSNKPLNLRIIITCPEVMQPPGRIPLLPGILMPQRLRWRAARLGSELLNPVVIKFDNPFTVMPVQVCADRPIRSSIRRIRCLEDHIFCHPLAACQFQ
jgi:hypothetical protein